jgi:hypothetical protein
MMYGTDISKTEIIDYMCVIGTYWENFSNPLRMEVYFCYQNPNAKNIGNFTIPLKPHNIGTHLKGIETSCQMVLLFLKSFHGRASSITFWNFPKIPSAFKQKDSRCLAKLGKNAHFSYIH